MKEAVGRVLSFVVVAGAWALVGIRVVLDVIGYATVPEDASVAQQRAGQFFLWLLAQPSWAVWLFALLATLFLIWRSWPGAGYPGIRRYRYEGFRDRALELAERSRAMRSDDTLLTHDAKALCIDLGEAGLKTPDFSVMTRAQKFDAMAFYLESVSPYLVSEKRGKYAWHAARDAAAIIANEVSERRRLQDTEQGTQP